jgi:hypothetical protein
MFYFLLQQLLRQSQNWQIIAPETYWRVVFNTPAIENAIHDGGQGSGFNGSAVRSRRLRFAIFTLKRRVKHLEALRMTVVFIHKT